MVTRTKKIEVFPGLLQEEFKITIDSSENYLGIQIKCQSDGSIFVSQKAYTNKIMKKFNLTEAKGVSTPASREESHNHKYITGMVPYLEALDTLMYLAAAPRPDIAFT